MERATSAPRRGPFRLAAEAFSPPVQGVAATLSIFLILLVFLGGGFAYAWQRWGTLVQNHLSYALDGDRIELPPQRDWIPGGDGGSDDQRAAWLAAGRRGRVLVTAPRFHARTNAGLPADAVGDTLPVGSPGAPWGDPAVAEAAAIVETLRDAWRGARLYRVLLTPPPPGTRGRLPDRQCLLVTRDGTELVWGHAVGTESGTEAKASDKIFRLARLAEQPGALSPAASETPWDLREACPPPPLRSQPPATADPRVTAPGASSQAASTRMARSGESPKSNGRQEQLNSAGTHPCTSLDANSFAPTA